MQGVASENRLSMIFIFQADADAPEVPTLDSPLFICINLQCSKVISV